MITRTSIVVVIVAILTASNAMAKPVKGFLNGPYLTIEAGIVQADNDGDKFDGSKVGADFEPSIGFLFGWNITSKISTELQGRYSTHATSGRRNHIAQAGIYGRWFFINKSLTNFPTLRILPTVKAGMAVRASILPGDAASNDSTVTQLGWGPSIGTGLLFLWKQYFFFGIDVQEDFLNYEEKRQTIGGISHILVYDGGFHPSFSALAIIGVHY